MTRVADYSQVLIKASVERSRLLSKRQIKSLAECRSLDEMASQLRGTAYESLLSDIREPNAAKLQYAFKEEMIRVCKKILAYSPKRIRDSLENYIRYLEVENLEILIKMKSMGAPYDSILSMLHLSVDEILGLKGRFIQAAKASDVSSAIEAFRNTVYEPALSEGLKRYEETRSTRFFDFSLDRTYYDSLLNSAKSLPKADRRAALLLAGMRVDAFNIITIIRSKLLDYPPHLTFWAITRRFYLLSENQIRSMVSSGDVGSILDSVKETFYGRFLTQQRSIEETVMAFERKVDNFIMKRINRMRIAEPFTISSLLDVILRKEAEVKNLTLISSGIEFGWKPEDISQFLI